MARLRIRYSGCRPGLILTDTPRPNCWACHGEGGHRHYYGHPEDGGYAITTWESCPCWDKTRCWTMLPLPRSRSRSHSHGTEPPF